MMKSKHHNKWLKLKTTLTLTTVIFAFFCSCDFIAAGSNLMAERYDIALRRDSLMNIIYVHNGGETGQIDSIFELSKNNPNFYKGYIKDSVNSSIYWILMSSSDDYPVELLLLSVEDCISGDITIVYDKPENKQEAFSRNLVIKILKTKCLINQGSSMIKKGNAMNKSY